MGNRENRTGIYELEQDPEIPDLFRIALRNLSLRLRTHTVAKVTSYNNATQKAIVNVDILHVIKDNITQPTLVQPNPTKTQDPVILENIPVIWPRTNAGYITFPLVSGDTGELHIQDRSLKLWLETGLPRDPVSAFTHILSDSVFHPGIHVDANPITPATSLTATVVHGPLVHLGRSATLGVARLNDPVTTSSLAVLQAAFVAWVPAFGDGGTALKTALAAFLALPAPDVGAITGASTKAFSE